MQSEDLKGSNQSAQRAERSLTVVLCGEAGQGIKTIEHALTHILKKANYYIFATEEYMSRVRGGHNSTEIRVANSKISAFVYHVDVLIALSPNVAEHLGDRITSDTLIVGKQQDFPTNSKIVDIDLEKVAIDIGNKIYANTLAIGFVLGILKISANCYQDYFAKRFAGVAPDVLQKNILAVEKGYEVAVKTLDSTQSTWKLAVATADLTHEILLNGSEAMALGAIAGGCNFIASYPMTPGSGVFTQLALYSHDFGIIVEQAEDEIAALNMALGAWYAGARALVSTAGGGFSLMVEALSLAGMIESPVVINLGQRPAPATGLPTRTEQADLNLALYAGHGEFPRIIFAPGTVDQAFYLMQQAFYFADKYQVPVIILSDQYFLDSYYMTSQFDPSRYAKEQQFIVKTDSAYKRYQITADGISPRGISGFGDGIVCVDSDEHTEEGYITEDFAMREKMVEKRMRKLLLIKNELIDPEFIGAADYKILVVCWGSNYHVAKEALEIISRVDIALLHFSQVYPLPYSAQNYFTKALRVVVIENNATGQFAKLLQQELKVNVDSTILKYNGLPFAVEEIVNKFINNKTTCAASCSI